MVDAIDLRHQFVHHLIIEHRLDGNVQPVLVFGSAQEMLDVLGKTVERSSMMWT